MFGHFLTDSAVYVLEEQVTGESRDGKRPADVQVRLHG